MNALPRALAILLLGTAGLSAVAEVSASASTVDRWWVLSPQWLVLANDYRDETDARIYAANRPAFDALLAEQEKLERSETPNWTAVKRRKSLWVDGAISLGDQHLWMRDPQSFRLRDLKTNGTPAIRTPLQAISWVNALGDRPYAPGSPLRGCTDYEAGHYAFLQLPAALTNGSAFRVEQKDGRVAEIRFDDATGVTPVIKVNQAGYVADASRKFAYLGGWIPTVGPVDYRSFKTFEVCRESTGERVFSGTISVRSTNLLYAGEILHEMDFSPVRAEGLYHIRIPGLGRSWPFLIASQALGEAFYVAARGFYHQRCGCRLEQPYTAWTRGRCHPPPVYACSLPGNGGNIWTDPEGRKVTDIRGIDFEVIKATADRSKAYDIWGGWHDAADYDRRASHHFAAWDLMGTYELNPSAFSDGQLNIPESGNGIPDLLDEAVYGLSVWKRAQRPDGGVSGRVETLHHPQHRGMPDRDGDPFFKSLETRESTMAYAASAAQAGWLLRPFDREASEEWVDSARRAYAWAMRPGDASVSVVVTVRVERAGSRVLQWKEPKEAPYLTGLHAALQLYRATSNATYQADLASTFIPYALRYFDSYPNYLFHSWGLFELASWPGLGVPDKDRQLARERLLARADEAVRLQEQAPYRHPWDPAKSRRWGAALAATQGRYCLLAWKLTGEERYRSAAQLCADFHLGCNALGLCQTTGLGSAYVCAVQDAESREDGLLDPVPGITPYGIISVPAGARDTVYSLPGTRFGISRPAYFLPPPYDVPNPPIPLWRQYGPNGRHDPLNNEFTVQETMSPAVLLFGALLGEGWLPPAALKSRHPRSRDDLNGYFWLP